MKSLFHPVDVQFTVPENAVQDYKNGDCAAGFYAKLLS